MRSRFVVTWDWRALTTFYKLPLHTATMVDHAVIRFAEHGEGQVDWDPPYYLLVAGFYDVVINVDREQRTMAVLRIYRAR
jgi:hypothetical protein